MSRKINLFQLLRKKMFDGIFLKVFTIINAALVISLGIVVISIALNYHNYNLQKIKSFDYYRQITFIDLSDSVSSNSQLTELKAEEYVNYRLMSQTSITVSSIEDVNISILDLKLTYFCTDNNEFLLPCEINSGFNIIGSSSIHDDEVIISYYQAVKISELMNMQYTEILGKSITLNGEGSFQKYTIAGVIDEESTMRMEYISNNTFFVKSNSSINVSSATYEYNDINQLKYINNRYNDKDLVVHHYIDSYISITNEVKIIAIILLFLGIVTIIVSNGIIMSSINMEFINQLPFLSVLKIIGVKNSVITMFTYVQSIIIVFSSLLLSVPLSLIMTLVINFFVNTEILFGNLDFAFVKINSNSFIICLVIQVILHISSFVLQVFKVRRLNIANTFLYELED